MTLALTRAPFASVLVANRGEIACRIIRTLRRLGVRSIAVFSDADRNAPHVRLADAAVCIGPAPAQASYLDVDAIIGAARRTGAVAVHPGYGFLSENAALAEACTGAGIVFVGPGVHALKVMGDKIAAKKEAARFGVPIIPGVAERGLSDGELVLAAERVGYPLLVKPSAGGGGKGMQVVHEPDVLPEALRAARRLAAGAFGDDTLFLERLISSPRHIEVQVLADRRGAVVHLGERECSLQRRHQKVVEEAPSPLLDAETRARIGEAACRVATGVSYVSAGTVEFLVSADQPGEFFFMEMNTRLQVEHPVTELVTGVDLVEWQLRIAAGEPLGFSQDDVRIAGHAVEARVYAENPEQHFLPGGGTVLALREPSAEGVRVDSGIAAGAHVVTDYDPMLAKVIAWAPDRQRALARLDRALADTAVLGMVSNIAWLRDLLVADEVRAGSMDTTLIDRRFSALEPAPASVEEVIAAALVAHGERKRKAPVSVGPLWSEPSGWRLGEPCAVRYDVDDTPVDVLGNQVVLPGGKSADVRTRDLPVRAVRADGERHHDAPAGDRHVGATVYTARIAVTPTAAGQPDAVVLELDGVVTRFDAARAGRTIWLAREGRARSFRLRTQDERLATAFAARLRGEATVQPEVRSPMPGTVVALPITSADTVAVGDTIVVVEAMKMEHRLVAPIAGTVTIKVGLGDLVTLDQLLAVVDPPQSDAPKRDGSAPAQNVPPISADSPEPAQPVALSRSGVIAAEIAATTDRNLP